MPLHYTDYHMGKVTLQGYKCERCGHVWVPRSTTDDTPTICPKCKSPYWDKPRKAVNPRGNLGKEVMRETVNRAIKRRSEQNERQG